MGDQDIDSTARQVILKFLDSTALLAHLLIAYSVQQSALHLLPLLRLHPQRWPRPQLSRLSRLPSPRTARRARLQRVAAAAGPTVRATARTTSPPMDREWRPSSRPQPTS